MRLFLVRHGHAGSKKAWSGDDSLRPLDGRGRRQAEAIAQSLSKTKVTRILSSPYVRSIETVEPLAARRKLELELVPALAVDGGQLAALDLVQSLIAEGHGGVVLCTHREVLNVVLPELSRRFKTPLGHRLPGAKAGTWVLEIRREKIASFRYVGPPK